MSISKILQAIVPKGFLWRLTSVNIIVVAGTIVLSGLAIYHTACFLVDGIGNFSVTRQQQFNTTLFQYVFLFAIIAVFISSIIHFYLTKKLIDPVNKLIESTKILNQGSYPERLPVSSKDEIGQLTTQYNELIQQLQENEQYRKKLVADISHELRTPIANVTGYLHALKSGDIEANPQLFEALHGQAVQLSLLMEQMDSLTVWKRIGNEKFMLKKEVQIKSVIEESVQMFTWKLAEKDLNVTINVEEAVVFIHKEGIRQVLNNLIDNAIRYYKGNGPIIIQGIKRVNDYHFIVENPGDEIEKEQQDQLFNRFYRVEKSRNRETGGTGLGLAIAKEIIENHGGQMEVRSECGNNTFSFTIPIE